LNENADYEIYLDISAGMWYFYAHENLFSDYQDFQWKNVARDRVEWTGYHGSD